MEDEEIRTIEHRPPACLRASLLPVHYGGGVGWSNCGWCNIGLGGWGRGRGSGGGGGGGRRWWRGGGGGGGGSVATSITSTLTIISFIRSSISQRLSSGIGGVAVSSKTSESRHTSISDGLLEGGSPEDGHVVGGVGELEEDGQAVGAALGGGLGQGEEGERSREDLGGIGELELGQDEAWWSPRWPHLVHHVATFTVFSRLTGTVEGGGYL